MKKCPFCGAEIEETASFCLYCMESLDKKEDIIPIKIPDKKHRQIVWIIVAFAALILFLFGLFKIWNVLPLEKELHEIWNLMPWSNNDDDFTTTVTAQTDEVKPDNSVSKNTYDATISENKSSDFSYGTASQSAPNWQNQTSKVTSFASGGLNTNNTYTSSNKKTSSAQKPSSNNKTSSVQKPSSTVQTSSKTTVTDPCVNGHKWVDATCTKPATCSVCKKTSGNALSHEIDVTKCFNCEYTDFSKIAKTYTDIYSYDLTTGEDFDVQNVSISSSGVFSFTFNGEKYNLKLVQKTHSKGSYERMVQFDCYVNGKKEPDALVEVDTDYYIPRLEWKYLQGHNFYIFAKQ